MAEPSGKGRRVVIVGASAAGLRCAARLSRLQPDWSITVIERRERFSFAACGLPYLVSGDLEGPDVLLRTADGTLRDAEYFHAVKGVTVLAGWEARSLDPEGRVLTAARDGELRELPWDDLVLATGARPRRLPFQIDHPRIRGFHSLEDGAWLRKTLERGELQTAVIAGAGLRGCELAEALRGLWGVEVTLLEEAPWPLPGLLDSECGALAARALRDNGVLLHTDCRVSSVTPGETGVEVVAGGETFSGDLLVVAAGVDPETDLARAAGVRLGSTGAIAVDETMATSRPGIWAAGDCVECRHAVTGEPAYLPLGSLANRQGRMLADVLAGRPKRFPPVAGATAIKIFDWNVATAGCSRRALEAAGLPHASVWTCAHDRAHYYPEAKELYLHLIYEPESGRILGLQALGEGDAIKRADVVAQLIVRESTVAELADMEHAYAPPYAPAVDPLAVAAWAAMNQMDGLRGDPPGVSVKGIAVLDVRHETERTARSMAAADLTEIALEELRQGIDGLPKRRWLVVCERGGRSAEAARLLGQRGHPCTYLGGGFRWRQRITEDA